MMRGARFALVAVGLSLIAVRGAAQEIYTPEQDLDCAVITAIVSGQANDEEKSGLGVLLAHFVGLYEGKTGKAIDEAMATRAAAMTAQQAQLLIQPCQRRSVAFAERLQALGRRMTAQGN